MLAIADVVHVVVFADVVHIVVVFVDVVERVIGLVGKEDLLNVVVLVDVFDCVAVELCIIPPTIKFLEWILVLFVFVKLLKIIISLFIEFLDIFSLE